MPLLMNIKLDGIPGDSKSYSHKGWAEVLSWNWGMTSNRKLPHHNGDDKTSLNELSFVKLIGTDSSLIRLFYAQGKVIPSVEFSMMPSLGKREAPTKYLHLKMEDVVIKSVVTGGLSEDNSFKEHITLLFDRINFDYSKNNQPANGSTVGTIEGFEFGWNIPGNAEWKV